MFQNATEELKPVSAVIEGNLPPWIQGTYLRVGPGKFDFDNFTLNHWFDGYAIISKFKIEAGKIEMTTKFLESDAFKRACAAKKPVICEFGTKASADPSKGFFSRIVSSIIPEFSDNTNINLFRIGEEIFVTGETCFFRNLFPDKLLSTEKHDTYKTFCLNVCSAHPLRDVDGAIYNIGSSVLTGLKYHIVRLPPANSAKETLKAAKLIATIPSRWNTLFSYNHSFGMTPNYFVFIEQPFVLNATKLLSISKGQGQCFSDWLEWKPELGNRFYIVEKASGKVLKTEYMSEIPFFFLHYINCYERDGHLVILLSIFDSPEVLFSQSLERLRSNVKEDDRIRAYGAKFVLPLTVDLGDEDVWELVTLEKSVASAYKQGKIVKLKHEVITQKGLELPTINGKLQGKKSRYYWATGLTSETSFRNCVCKIDEETKERTISRQDGEIFGEPIFIPTPNASREDDGTLMVPMANTVEGQQDGIYFFDAESMETVAKATFPVRVPASIHGLFLRKI